MLYEDCEISPDAAIPAEESGARLGKALVGYDNGCYNGSEWKQMTYEFDSGDSTSVELGLYNGVKTALCKGTAYFSDIKLEADYPWGGTYQYNKSSGVTFSVDKENVYADETTYDIALYNGMWFAGCKGTAYFSGFTLEKYEPVTDWNVLAVIFTSVKAPIEKNGKQVTFRRSLNTADVKYLTAAFEDMYTSVPILSEGRWGINSIDIYTEKSPVTELKYHKVT